jgi:dolichyl-phosphate beta-glucosyltransferase
MPQRTHRPYLSLIVPAYNEAKVIGQTIAEAQDYFAARGLTYEIIVSADGDDGTRELVAAQAKLDPRLSAIGETRRRGKGYAVRQAVLRSAGRFVGFTDADRKTPIQELDKVLPWLEDGYDLVIGSRALGDSRIERYQPWYRRLGSRGFGIVMHWTVGLREIPDTQCGFKFFRREVALELFRRQKVDGYMYDVEILVLSTQLGYRIRQQGIRWQDDGDSRLQLVRGNIRNGLDLLGIGLRHLAASRLRATSERPVVSEVEEG